MLCCKRIPSKNSNYGTWLEYNLYTNTFRRRQFSKKYQRITMCQHNYFHKTTDGNVPNKVFFIRRTACRNSIIDTPVQRSFEKYSHGPNANVTNHDVVQKFDFFFIKLKVIVIRKMLERPFPTGKITPYLLLSWKELLSPPTNCRDDAVRWKLWHDRLVTPAKLYRWKNMVTDRFLFCTEVCDVFHMITYCSAHFSWHVIERRWMLSQFAMMWRNCNVKYEYIKISM